MKKIVFKSGKELEIDGITQSGKSLQISIKSSDVKSGAKEITIVVEHGNKVKKEFVYQTDEKYLGAVLQKEKLVEGTMGEYGLFILSVDGEKADDGKQQWWCVTKSKNQVNTGADKTPIKDGDTFELTMTEGY